MAIRFTHIWRKLWHVYVCSACRALLINIVKSVLQSFITCQAVGIRAFYVYARILRILGIRERRRVKNLMIDCLKFTISVISAKAKELGEYHTPALNRLVNEAHLLLTWVAPVYLFSLSNTLHFSCRPDSCIKLLATRSSFISVRSIDYTNTRWLYTARKAWILSWMSATLVFQTTNSHTQWKKNLFSAIVT